jgi:Zn-dependent protease
MKPRSRGRWTQFSIFEIQETSMKWKLGDIAGISVYVHWSFWILPGWILLSSWSAGGGLLAGLAAAVFVFAVFGCVVLHEVGHALAARRFRIGTRDITLYPIGGVANLERMPTRPSRELAIALAGPAVNVAIAAALFGLILLGGMGSQVFSPTAAGGAFLVNLMWVNVALVLFNLLPAFPMDGGRVLRAFLAMGLPRLTATTVAARVGQVMAVVLGLIGLFTGGMLVLVALFVFLAAQAELTMARMQSGLRYHGWPSPSGPRARGPYDAPVDDPGIIWVGEVHLYGNAPYRDGPADDTPNRFIEAGPVRWIEAPRAASFRSSRS